MWGGRDRGVFLNPNIQKGRSLLCFNMNGLRNGWLRVNFFSSSAAPRRERAGEPSKSHEDTHGHIEPFDVIRVGVTAAIAGLVWFRVWEPVPRISLIGLAGILFGGYPIFREAFENLRERRMTMELSMTIALLAAACIGEFFTALII